MPTQASLAELLPAAEHAAVKAEAAARAAAAERRAAAADPHEELHPGLRLHAPPAPHAAPLCALLPALLGALLRLGDGGGGGAAARPGRGCELQLAEVILAPHLPAAPDVCTGAPRADYVGRWTRCTPPTSTWRGARARIEALPGV